MPELPEVEALVDQLRRYGVGKTITRIDIVAMSVLKTYDPAPTALYGHRIISASRWGKYLGIQVDTRPDALWFITHLSRAGWLKWSDALSAVPPKPGKGPIAMRVHCSDNGDAPHYGTGFDLTEAGSRKRLAVWIVMQPNIVPGIATLGPDALQLTVEQVAHILHNHNGRMKTVITDQKIIAGIGNAYSDEILYAAAISPFSTASKLTDTQLVAFYDAMRSVLTDAVQRLVGQQAATLKGEKRSGLRVHARTGLPCALCGDTIREVSYANTSFQYCPTCQTGGKILADRRMSRLLK